MQICLSTPLAFTGVDRFRFLNEDRFHGDLARRERDSLAREIIKAASGRKILYVGLMGTSRRPGTGDWPSRLSVYKMYHAPGVMPRYYASYGLKVVSSLTTYQETCIFRSFSWLHFRPGRLLPGIFSSLARVKGLGSDSFVSRIRCGYRYRSVGESAPNVDGSPCPLPLISSSV